MYMYMYMYHTKIRTLYLNKKFKDFSKTFKDKFPIF